MPPRGFLLSIVVYMNQITVDDVTYTFIEHAETRMARLKISAQMVEETLLDPNDIQPSRSSSRTVYMKVLQGRKRPLIVVVNEATQEIITAYWSEL